MKRLILCFSLLPIVAFAVKAPDFTITDYNNKTHRLYADYLDKNKVVVLKLFFVDCPPCNSLAPTFQQSYVKWGSGNDRVQFIELSTQIWDQNANVKAYSQKHGLTFPGAGKDGGSIEATAPYKSGTFGPYYGTPTFAVIAPNGEVQWNVNYTRSNQVDFDTAVARALRMTGGSGGGDPDPKRCQDSFGIRFTSKILPDQIFIRHLNDPLAPEFTLQDYRYNCEYPLPQDKSPYYIVPFKSTKPNDWITGITTADIIAIQKHILGLSQLNNLQLAVADVNNSGSVTAFDISEMRKLILGTQDRFRSLSETHTWTLDPFLKTNTVSRNAKLTEMISGSKSNVFGMGKYGDVSDAAFFSGNSDNLEARTQKTENLRLKINPAGGNYKNELFFSNDFRALAGFQIGIDMTPSELMDISFDPEFGEAEYHFVMDEKGRYSMRIIWFDPIDTEKYFGRHKPFLTILSASKIRLSPEAKFQSEIYVNDSNHSIQAYSLSLFNEPGTDKISSSVFARNVNPGEFMVNSTGSKISYLDIYNLSGQKLFPANVSGLGTEEVKVNLDAQGIIIVCPKTDEGFRRNLKIFVRE